ncbi:MAG TPA: helix-turn-helix domain-containing protein [Caulobacteraceae bacterium]|nr:helix-turn-helix domain-containing protein [Caulobacteraceae bacterium]
MRRPPHPNSSPQGSGPTSPATGRRRTPAITRERILAAAERLFAEQGFDRVSMPAIAAASGVTAGAIYRHFPSKADLFFEIVRQAVQAAPVTPAEGEVSLPAIVGAYTTRRLKRVRQLAIEVHAASTRDPDVRRLLRRTLERQIAELATGMAAGQRAGAFDASLDPELAASLLFVLIMGLAHMETLLPGKVGDATWRAFVEARVAAVFGVAAPG